jgi:hypothetical protein
LHLWLHCVPSFPTMKGAGRFNHPTPNAWAEFKVAKTTDPSPTTLLSVPAATSCTAVNRPGPLLFRGSGEFELGDTPLQRTLKCTCSDPNRRRNRGSSSLYRRLLLIKSPWTPRRCMVVSRLSWSCIDRRRQATSSTNGNFAWAARAHNQGSMKEKRVEGRRGHTAASPAARAC